MRSSVAIVIPAYNEEENITAAVKQVRAVCSHDITVVDDGSTDGTLALARKTSADKVIETGHGEEGHALQATLHYLAGKYCTMVIQDGDLTIPAATIPELVRI